LDLNPARVVNIDISVWQQWRPGLRSISNHGLKQIATTKPPAGKSAS
jgi:hypothetical protein